MRYRRSVPDAAHPRPVLLYDGECRFCIAQAERLARAVGGRVRLESFRDAGVLARYPGVTPEACEQGMQLVEPDGKVFAGVEAGARVLGLRPLLAPLGWLYYVPGLRQLIDRMYTVIVRNRFRLGGRVCVEESCRVPPVS